MEITEMTLEDLEQMKNTLYSDFDNFWSYNVLKQELVNDKTKYIIAKEKNEVVGFAGISVIFDEATSNLDQLTEKKIYDNLRSTNKTQIIITHRLSSIRDTDYIYVLNRGSIIEQGTHLDLMKKKGWYFESIQ